MRPVVMRTWRAGARWHARCTCGIERDWLDDDNGACACAAWARWHELQHTLTSPDLARDVDALRGERFR